MDNEFDIETYQKMMAMHRPKNTKDEKTGLPVITVFPMVGGISKTKMDTFMIGVRQWDGLVGWIYPSDLQEAFSQMGFDIVNNQEYDNGESL